MSIRWLQSASLLAGLSIGVSALAQDVPDGYRPAREVLGDASAVDSSRPARPVDTTQAPAVEEPAAEETASAPETNTPVVEEPAKPEMELPPAGQIVGVGDSTIRVTVRGQVGDNYDSPIANQHVELTVLQPPHGVNQRLHAVTGDDGVATFQAISGPGLQAFARAFRDGREVFAPTGLSLAQSGEFRMTVQDMPTVADPRVVFAPRIITIAEVWEDYLVFTQVFTLATDQPVIFKSEGSARSAGLIIPLPEGAAGVRVIQPADQAEVAGNAVMFRGEVRPSGAGEQAPTLILRYSLRHNNARTVKWAQKFAFDVENLSLVIPQQTEHPRHPLIDVAVKVPMCDDSANPSVMCFNDISDRAEGVQMLAGKAVRVARGGQVKANGVMEVTTTGWPADPHYGRWASGIVGAFALILGATLFARSRRRSSNAVNVRERLVTAREALLQRIEDLEIAYLSGQVLELEYESEQELIVGELALIERRLREMGAARD